jgi:hypothetical protein
VGVSLMLVAASTENNRGCAPTAVGARVLGAASVDDEVMVGASEAASKNETAMEGVATAREEKDEATGVGSGDGGSASRLCRRGAGDVARAKGGIADGGVREEVCAAVRKAGVTKTAVTAREPERSTSPEGAVTLVTGGEFGASVASVARAVRVTAVMAVAVVATPTGAEASGETNGTHALTVAEARTAGAMSAVEGLMVSASETASEETAREALTVVGKSAGPGGGNGGGTLRFCEGPACTTDG